ncbi:hypothetical protein HMPREF1982_01307 [Clostridiales bacterium oral taxon 876 str. F0540]|nr:hypothetical protein HMPREF1982_01307 [Clostridiales bacterium oral taxon 876 str. F0540]
MHKVYGLLLINILLLVIGQTMWKMGLQNINLQLTLVSILKIFTNIYILIGLALYAVATLIWFYILSKADLSLVYPLQSLCYVIAAFVGMYIFKEKIPSTRWLGIMFIIIGAYFVSKK